MNEGWIRYDGSNPPTDTSKGLHTKWDDGVEGYWSAPWYWPANVAKHVVAYKYHAPYVDPEPEMPEVVYLDEVGSWYHEPRVSGFFYARYRRCVEMTPVLDGDGDLRCALCGEYSSPGDNFCPACGAEVKR